MKKTPALHAVALAACAFTSAHAVEVGNGVTVDVSGYGTVAATATNNDQLEFRSKASRSKGVGQSIDLGNDSRFGIQAVVKFNADLSVTGQLVGQRRMTGAEDADFGRDKDFDPQVEWLYAQYNALPSLNLRLGRVVLPAFLLSDSLNVGYAAPWLRAPLHLYSSQLMSNLDGVQANWRDSFGGVNLSAQATYGKAEAYGVLPNLGAFHIDSKDTYAFSATAEYSDWTARVGTVRLNTPFTGIPGIEPTIHDKYVSAGLQYDNGSALVLAEWARRTQNAMPFVGKVIEGKYAYVAAGWRFGSVLPMVIWSKADNEMMGGADKTHPSSIGVSLRYDVAPNIALKTQVDQFKANDPEAFVTPDAASQRKVSVFSLGADFVF